MGALCCVGRCFGCAGRAGPGWAQIWHMSFLHVFMMSLCLFDLIDFLALFGVYAGIMPGIPTCPPRDDSGPCY